MGRRRFAQVDVFGPDGAPATGGNPVAVVLDGQGLGDDELQRFASWTNLAETTFVLPPTRPEADYRLRIFTTSRELPFAGHPTLGSAHAWVEAAGGPEPERVVQECAAGLIELRRIEGRWAFAAPPLVRGGPLDDETVAQAAVTLGIDPSEVVDHAWTDNGPGWATVLLASAERVLDLVPRPGGARDVGVVGLHPDGTPEVRAIVTEGGEAPWEDPATGSLNAGVAMWLLANGRLTAPYVAHQGTAIGRTGRIHVDQDADGVIWVGGGTQTVVSGTASL